LGVDGLSPISGAAINPAFIANEIGNIQIIKRK
jgi:hypothetical protein